MLNNLKKYFIEKRGLKYILYNNPYMEIKNNYINLKFLNSKTYQYIPFDFKTYNMKLKDKIRIKGHIESFVFLPAIDPKYMLDFPFSTPNVVYIVEGLEKGLYIRQLTNSPCIITCGLTNMLKTSDFIENNNLSKKYTYKFVLDRPNFENQQHRSIYCKIIENNPNCQFTMCVCEKDIDDYKGNIQEAYKVLIKNMDKNEILCKFKNKFIEKNIEFKTHTQNINNFPLEHFFVIKDNRFKCPECGKLHKIPRNREYVKCFSCGYSDTVENLNKKG